MRTMRGNARLDLFPDTASVENGELVLGGIRATDLAREFGTPVVVYDEQTLRNQARAYLEAAPGALVAYGTKAFPSLAVLRLFVEAGLGADVSTVGELEFALQAGMPGERLVIHGNNKEDELLQRSIEVGALIVLDSLDELERVHAAGGSRFLIRVTPGSRLTRTRRSRPHITARSSGCRPTMRSRRSVALPKPRACTSTSGRS